MASRISVVQVEAFHTVARTLSYVSAAEILGYSESAVHRNVRAIERCLGVRLFEVHHHRLRLSAVGTELVEVAGEIVARMEKFETLGAMFRDQPVRSIVIAASLSTSSFLLRYVLPDVGRQQPNVQCRVLAASDVVRLVFKGESQIGILGITVNSSELDSLAKLESHLSMTPWLKYDWLIVRGTTANQGQHSAAGPPQRIYYTQYHLDGRPALRKLLVEAASSQMECVALDSLDALKSAAIGGLGVALVPGFSVVDELKMGLLEYTSFPALRCQLLIVTLRRTSALIRSVRNHLAEWVPGEDVQLAGIEAISRTAAL